MTDKVDVRWIQRMDNYKRALAMLQQGVERLTHTADVNEDDLRLMQEGLIQRFEYTHELAWNVMKDYEQYQGYTDIHGSRDAIRKGLAIGLIDDPKWMNTIADRNITSHSYDDETAAEVISAIVHDYLPLFLKFRRVMEGLKED